MKKIRNVLSVFLIVCIALGFARIVFSVASESSESKKLVELADSYVEKKLYQKAINAYTEALDVSEDENVRKKLIKAYVMSYKDGTSSNSDITNALTVMVEKYPKELGYKEVLLKHYYNTHSYTEAYKFYKQLKRQGYESDTITDLGNKILYIYNNKGLTYFEYVRSITGVYVVREGDNEWNEVLPDGEELYAEPFYYISPNNVSSWTVHVSTEKGTRLKDTNGIVEAHITQKFLSSKAYGDGFLPVLNSQGDWQYIDCYADVTKNNKYEDVSSFTNGIAAVKSADKWSLIDTKFKNISSVKFDDIKLFQGGEYVNNDIMVASVGGKYGLYNAKAEVIVEPKYKDIDVYYGDLIAFCDGNNKWGFMDSSGNIVIKPNYVKAKSFSNGLAAVFNGEKWGFINRDGEVVIDYNFLEADYFTSAGTCMVNTYGGSYHLIELKFHE